jgi:glycosyltransferase involved in cell wall biosynthesis
MIFANLAKIFIKSSNNVTIVTNEKGYDFCVSQKVPGSAVSIQSSSWVDIYPVALVEAYKTIISTIRELFVDRHNPQLIFSSSFFLPDLIPAIIAKVKNPHAKLVVGVYLLFPSIFSFKKYHGGQLKLLILYLFQQISLVLIKLFSDLVLTASEKDTKLFNNAIAIRGGVDFKQIKKIKNIGKKYDVVYFGRFHSQKGLMDLLDIWQKIYKKRPSTSFLMAGTGPLEEEIITKAKKIKIFDRITFTGLLSGAKKYKILKRCRLFTSASRFDTGNMALDETLACGVPGIVYDLEHLNYPQGVIKVPVGNKNRMVRETISLLNNTYLRSKMGKNGKEFIKRYDWESISKKILNLLIS